MSRRTKGRPAGRLLRIIDDALAEDEELARQVKQDAEAPRHNWLLEMEKILP